MAILNFVIIAVYDQDKPGGTIFRLVFEEVLEFVSVTLACFKWIVKEPTDNYMEAGSIGSLALKLLSGLIGAILELTDHPHDQGKIGAMFEEKHSRLLQNGGTKHGHLLIEEAHLQDGHAHKKEEIEEKPKHG